MRQLIMCQAIFKSGRFPVEKQDFFYILLKIHRRVFVVYRHRIVWILSVHELHFDCDVASRALAVGKVETLRVHIQQIPKRWTHKEHGNSERVLLIDSAIEN